MTTLQEYRQRKLEQAMRRDAPRLRREMWERKRADAINAVAHPGAAGVLWQTKPKAGEGQ